MKLRLNKALTKSVENVDTAEDLSEAMPSVTKTASGDHPILSQYIFSQSSSASQASIAPELSSERVRHASEPWERGHEVLRIMNLGEPGRLAWLAPTYRSAESRARLTKPGELEMSLEEVKAAVRESPSSSLKRKFDHDNEEKGETPRPVKMSRFEERTALVDVYAPPTDMYTTYHPTKPRRTHRRSTYNEEQLHRPNKQRFHEKPSESEPKRTSVMCDRTFPIFGPIKHPHFDTSEYELPRQRPGAISELANHYATPKVQVERSPSPPVEAKTSTIAPPPQPPQDIQSSIPESPPTQRANSSHSDSGSERGSVEGIALVPLKNILDNLRARARRHLRKARFRARRGMDKELVKKMKESRRFAKELGPIKDTGTRPPPKIVNKEEEVHKPSEPEPSPTVAENILEIGSEARRRAGFWTAESEAEKVEREKMERDKEALIRRRERVLIYRPKKESRLRQLRS